MNAAIARVRVGWMKFRELKGVLCSRKWSVGMKGKVYRACVRTAMIYGSENWTLTKEIETVLQRAERFMVRMMCGVRLRDKKSSSGLLTLLGLGEDILTVVKKSRLRWYGHVMRRDETVGIRRVLEVEVSGAMGRGRPPGSWRR